MKAGKLRSFLNNYLNMRELSMILITLFICAVIAVINPAFLSGDNIYDLLRNTSILLILGTGMMRVLIIGGIDLSVSAVLAFSGMIASMVLAADNGIHPVVILLIGTALGTLCGAANGILVSKVHISPIIATLSMAYILRGATFLISGGQWVSANQMSDSFKNIAVGKFLGVNHLILLASIVLLLSYYFSAHMTLGRRMYAIGSNPKSAVVTGINIARVTIIAYMLMGTMAGLCGVLWASKFASAQSDSARNYELTVIASCVLGGVSITGGSGKVLGVFLGGLIMGILSNGLPIINVSSFWQNAIQGIVILIAVVANTLIRRGSEKRMLERRTTS
jgi:rhamnose transport system permease protein